MRLWRICRQVYDPLSGEGAQTAGGRWNKEGTPVVYTAEHLALAALELLVGFEERDMPEDLRYAELEVPQDLPVRKLQDEELPSSWADPNGCAKCQQLGTDWVNELNEGALGAPSSVLEEGRNYMLNPRHPDFNRVEIVRRKSLKWDERLNAMVSSAR